jgi:hypothetical protein
MNVTVALEDHVCASCGTGYAIAVRLGETRREHGGTFYCPNGHPQTYTVTELQRLRDSLAREQSAHAQTRAAREAAERKVARFEKGVCSMCHRHFANVERHMKSKHKK